MLEKYRRFTRDLIYLIYVVGISKKRRVLVFGDSHSRVLAGRGFLVRHLGPVTAYRAGKQGEVDKILQSALSWPRSKDRWLVRFLFRDPRSLLVCSFGEIDMRAHVYLQSIKQNRSGDEIVSSLAKSTTEFLLQVSAIAQRNVIFLSVPPPTAIELNSDFPVKGEIQDRVRWTRLFNGLIGESLGMTGSKQVAFLDIGGFMEDKDGTLWPGLSDGNVHYGRVCSKYVRQAIFLTAIRRGWWKARGKPYGNVS